MPFFLEILFLGAVIFLWLVIIPAESYTLTFYDQYDKRGIETYTVRFLRSIKPG